MYGLSLVYENVTVPNQNEITEECFSEEFPWEFDNEKPRRSSLNDIHERTIEPGNVLKVIEHAPNVFSKIREMD